MNLKSSATPGKSKLKLSRSIFIIFELKQKTTVLTYSGLDSGVRLDMSSDVGTKKKRKAEKEGRGRGKRM